MHEQLASFSASEGVVFIGRAQEKTTLFRTEKRRNAAGRAYPWIVKTTGMVNRFYFYCVDDDFGPFFLKFCSYFPYNAKLCLNGHHWAQRQAAKAGIEVTAMDNAFAAVDDVDALQRICDALGPTQIWALLDKWLAILPDPFPAADRPAGFGYQISILQAEFSLTQMLDAPITGRIFFEHVIRDNLDIGRADKVGVTDRQIRRRGAHPTPSRFRTQVIADRVIRACTPSTGIPPSSSPQGRRALRTKTTINDSSDFKIRKGLGSPALREIGFSAHHACWRPTTRPRSAARGPDLHTVLDPVRTEGGTTIPGLDSASPAATPCCRRC